MEETQPRAPLKRRRKRKVDRPAISARLLLDERAKGEIGTLSQDLFGDLFPNCSVDDEERIYYVAISPWFPNADASLTSPQWSILPLRPEQEDAPTDQSPHSSVQFPATSLALQSFLQQRNALFPGRPLRRDTPIEIRILDIVPLGLDTIYVTLDTEALRKLDETHAKFGGGFGVSKANGSLGSPRNRHLDVQDKMNKRRLQDNKLQQEQTWKTAVREALGSCNIIHTGTLLPLPLPAHPLTHVPPPPAKITACDPVGQGVILPDTRIVILQSRVSFKSSRTLSSPVTTMSFSGSAEDEEDTSNEQFFSAAEDRGSSQAPSPPDEASSTEQLESEMSGTDAGDLSDDSDEMITLDAPMLPPQASAVMSPMAAATPRPAGFGGFGGFHTTGVATPGSVFSGFSAATARGPSAKGKVFKAQGLLEHISDDVIHPKPATEDDDEARVFVETSTLVRIGCFSGDWVKVESSAEPSPFGLGSWGMGGAFGNDEQDPQPWRAAKIYGLPESIAKKTQQYSKKETHNRRSSVVGMLQPGSVSAVYLSPILLANVGNPSHLKLSPLSSGPSTSVLRATIQKARIIGSSLPPFAKEVKLSKLFTPLASERLLQPSLFAALKEHFEKKRRLIKSGDLIGVSIDERLGKAIFQGNNADDELEEELLSRLNGDPLADDAIRDAWRPKSVAWFKVNLVTKHQSEALEDDDHLWGGVCSVDSESTKLGQAGTEQGKVPSVMTSTWQYYLNAKRLPAAQVSLKSKGREMRELPKAYVSPLQRRLRELISAATSSRAIALGLPPIAILLTSTQRQIGKSTVLKRACDDLGLHTFTIDAFDILAEGGAGPGDYKTETYLKTRAERGLACGGEYTALLVQHIEMLSADRMATSLKEILDDSRILVATTTEVDKLSEGVRNLFTYELEISAPDEGEREGILRNIVSDSGVSLSPEVDLSSVAMKTAALVAGDLVDVVDRAVVAKQDRIEELARQANREKTDPNELVNSRDIQIAGGPIISSLTSADFTKAVDAARKNFADAIGAPKIPNVSWSDVGGLSHVKDAVMETIQLPLTRPELFAKGMKKRSGILFYGPPGTGKTLLAKAIATEFSLNFFSVKGPELLNMYIGESEANVRRVFQRARDARPCVVFFDELDSVAPKRGNQGDSGGVMDRIVSQLLAELDGMSNGEEGGGGVFVVGATNRPDLLDQALLRPGRFDKMLYLGVSDTHDKQLTILEALTRKFALSPSLSLRKVSEQLPFTYTGADLYALCSDAMLKAITRRAKMVDAKVKAHNSSLPPDALPISTAYFFDHYANSEDVEVVVEEVDFIEAKNELVPSVSVEELGHYDRVRRQFEGTAKKKEEHASNTQSLPTQETAQSQQQNGEDRPPLPLDQEAALSRLMGHIDGLVDTGKSEGLWKVDKSNQSTVHRGGKSAAPRVPSFESHQTGQAFHSSEDDDEDHSSRGDHLRSNGNVKGKGKGKGKAPAVFRDEEGADEDLYD